MKRSPAASSETGCRNEPLLFQDLGPRRVVAEFTDGSLPSDGEVLLPRQVERGLAATRALAACFQDDRAPRWVDHSIS